MKKPVTGGWNFFVDPAEKAGSARVFWDMHRHSGIVSARVTEAVPKDADGIIDLAGLACDKSLLIKPDHHEHLILSEGSKIIHLECMGNSVLRGAVKFEFIHYGLRNIEQKFQTLLRLKMLLKHGRFRSGLFRPTRHFSKLQNSLIALDGWRNSSRQRDIAVRIFGRKMVREQWTGRSDFLRSRVRRNIKRGIELMNGDYLDLLNSR